MNRLLAPVVTTFALALVAGCSRGEDEPKRQVDLTPPFARFAIDAGARPAAKAPRDEGWPSDGDAGKLHVNEVTIYQTRTIVREAGVAAPPVNPDDAVLESARRAAGGCFSSLAAGPGAPPERTAHIVFSVIPTGTVSSADVSSGDTTEPNVLDCLRQVALSTHFSDSGGGPLRTYAIDVRVIAKGSTGGR
jgi:hypothetical protein